MKNKVSIAITVIILAVLGSLLVLPNINMNQNDERISNTIPPGVVPSTFQTTIGTITLNTTFPPAPASVPLYRGHYEPGGHVTLSFPNWSRIKKSVPDESEIPILTEQALAPYGGIPQDAVVYWVGKYTSQGINRTTGEVVAVYLKSTNIAYVREINGMPVLGQIIQLDFGENGELLYLKKQWRTLNQIDQVPVISASEAFEKLRRGEVLNHYQDSVNVTINKIVLAYYAAYPNLNEEILEPVWVFMGPIDEDSGLEFQVDARVSGSSFQFANFTASPRSGITPLTVSFNDTSTLPVLAWHWDFGDGTYSWEQNPVHTYLNAGTYTVSLYADDSERDNTITKTNYIHVLSAGLPNANFSASVFAGTIPPVIQFVDTSTGSPELWNWSFGDGTFSTDQFPVKIYPDHGSYDVTLIVSNASGNSTPLTRTISISPVTEFSQPGDYTVPAPAGMPYANILVIGAGGGGGGGTWWQMDGEGGFGGSAGQRIISASIVNPGSNIPVTVGSRGSGGAGAGGGNPGGKGGDGGQSRFGSISASGGSGGLGGGLDGNWNGKPGQAGFGSGTYAENGHYVPGYGTGGTGGVGRGAGGGGAAVGTYGGRGANGTVQCVFVNIPPLPSAEFTSTGDYNATVPAGFRYAKAIAVGAGGGGGGGTWWHGTGEGGRGGSAGQISIRNINVTPGDFIPVHIGAKGTGGSGAGGGNQGWPGTGGGQSFIGTLVVSGGSGGVGGGLSGNWSGRPGQKGYGLENYAQNGNFVPGYGVGGLGGTGRGAGGGGAAVGTYGGAGSDGYAMLHFSPRPLPVHEFTAPGTYTNVSVPDGMHYANIVIVGAGGGGGGGTWWHGTGEGGFGGSAGQAIVRSISVIPGDLLPVTVGAKGNGGGGAGGGNNGWPGTVGGQSSVGSVIASGGTGGTGGGLSGSWNGKPGQNGYGSGTFAQNGNFVPGYGTGGTGGTGLGAGGGGAAVGTSGGAGADGYVFIEFTTIPREEDLGFGMKALNLPQEYDESYSRDFRSGADTEKDQKKNQSWIHIRQGDADGLYAKNGSYLPVRMKIVAGNITKTEKVPASLMVNTT